MKNKILFLICMELIPIISYSQTATYYRYWIFIYQGDSLYKKSNYKAAYKAYKKALHIGKDGLIRPAHLYNGACCAAKANQKNVAFKWLLQQVMQKKNWYSDGISNDSDLVSLHNDRRWNILMDTLQQRKLNIERNYDKPLQKELKDILEYDQGVRIKYIAETEKAHPDSVLINCLIKEMEHVDSINLQKVTHILDTRGWVGQRTVGNAARSIWLVIQHADISIEKKYLPMIRNAVERGDISPDMLGMLEDRINTFEGKKQRYGSQITMNNDGSYSLDPLEDPKMIDQWRESIGMEPICCYVKLYGIIWPKTSSK